MVDPERQEASGTEDSEKAAEFMRTNVPGVHIPDEIIDRLRKTPKEKKRKEGKRICVEIIQQVREIEGVAGVHVMAYRQEELVAEIIEDSTDHGVDEDGDGELSSEEDEFDDDD